MENPPKFCYNCGGPLSAGARFCASCGQAVVAAGGVPPVSAPIAATPGKQRTFSWMALIAGIILGSIIGAAGMYLLSPKPQTLLPQNLLGTWEVTCSSDFQGNGRCFERSSDGEYRLSSSIKPNIQGFYFNLNSPDLRQLSAEIGANDMPQALQIELALSGDDNTVFGIASSNYMSQTFTLARRASSGEARSQVLPTLASNATPARQPTAAPPPLPTPQVEGADPDLNLRLVFYGYQQGNAKNGLAKISRGKLSAIQEITFLRFGGELSPDGSRIAYDDCVGHIYRVDLNGNQAGKRTTVSASGGCHDIRWSPDGTKISYSGFQGDQKLHIIDLSSGQDSAVPKIDGVDWHWWSPDGKEIVYGKAMGTNQAFRLLFITDLNGNSRQLTFVEDFEPCERDGNKVDTWSPAWSPDGQMIAFTQCGKLFTISPDGANLRQITAPIDAYSPRWSPDGKWILFDAYQSIRAISPDGTETHEVGQLPYYGGPFSIGPLNQ